MNRRPTWGGVLVRLAIVMIFVPVPLLMFLWSVITGLPAPELLAVYGQPRRVASWIRGDASPLLSTPYLR